MAKRNSTRRRATKPKFFEIDVPRLGPYLVDTIDATCTLDEAIGALSLAYDAVIREAGANQTLAHAFGSMRLSINCLNNLRGTLLEAEAVEVAHG
jgi:hypothetical protein